MLGHHAVAHPIDFKALLNQTGTQARPQEFIVFSQQDSHGHSVSNLKLLPDETRDGHHHHHGQPPPTALNGHA